MLRVLLSTECLAGIGVRHCVLCTVGRVPQTGMLRRVDGWIRGEVMRAASLGGGGDVCCAGLLRRRCIRMGIHGWCLAWTVV